MEMLQSEKAQRDYKLVLAAREQDDQNAYADLMHHYREPVYLMFLRMTHDPMTADDLTMETFSKAFSQLTTYSPQNTFATWLFSIASNRGIDFIRRRHMDTVSLSSVSVRVNEEDTLEYPVPSNDPNPEEALIDSQLSMALTEVVEQLPERYRRIVKLRYYEELSYEEISAKLRIPLGTVKIHLRRARQLLAETMKDRL